MLMQQQHRSVCDYAWILVHVAICHAGAQHHCLLVKANGEKIQQQQVQLAGRVATVILL